MKKLNGKKYVLGIIFLVFCVFFAYESWHPKTWQDYLGEPEAAKVDMKEPLREQSRIIKIGERTFKIPLMYVDGQLDKGIKQDGINLKYVLPDYTSVLEFKNKEEYQRAFEEHRFAIMLVKPSSSKLSLAKMVQNHQENEELTKYRGLEYGLERYSDFDSPKHLGIQWDDTYLEKDKAGNIISFLRCSPDGKDPIPGCSHYFVDKNIFIKVHYNKEKYLKNWRDMQAGAIAFMGSFEMQGE